MPSLNEEKQFIDKLNEEKDEAAEFDRIVDWAEDAKRAFYMGDKVAVLNYLREVSTVISSINAKLKEPAELHLKQVDSGGNAQRFVRI